MGLLALGWGALAASAVFIGAMLAWHYDVPARLSASVMAFGSGVLLSLIAFDTLDDAYLDGGLWPSVAGMAIGAGAFTIGLLHLDRHGARDRKRAHTPIVSPRNAAGVVALATVLDVIPESLIIGLNFANGETVALATVIAVFLSNIPESMSATTRMKRAGRSAAYVFGVWTAVAVVGGLATLIGYQLFAGTPEEWTAVAQAITAGALLALLVDTMIPEAFAETREAAGLVASLGFITGFFLTHGL
jgi:ZIP family zinc transporter